MWIDGSWVPLWERIERRYLPQYTHSVVARWCRMRKFTIADKKSHQAAWDAFWPMYIARVRGDKRGRHWVKLNGHLHDFEWLLCGGRLGWSGEVMVKGRRHVIIDNDRKQMVKSIFAARSRISALPG